MKEAKGGAKDAGVGIKVSAVTARAARARVAIGATVRVAPGVRAALPLPDSRGEDPSGVEGMAHHRVAGMARAEGGGMIVRETVGRTRLVLKRRLCR